MASANRPACKNILRSLKPGQHGTNHGYANLKSRPAGRQQSPADTRKNVQEYIALDPEHLGFLIAGMLIPHLETSCRVANRVLICGRSQGNFLKFTLIHIAIVSLCGYQSPSVAYTAHDNRCGNVPSDLKILTGLTGRPILPSLHQGHRGKMATAKASTPASGTNF